MHGQYKMHMVLHTYTNTLDQDEIVNNASGLPNFAIHSILWDQHEL